MLCLKRTTQMYRKYGLSSFKAYWDQVNDAFEKKRKPTQNNKIPDNQKKSKKRRITLTKRRLLKLKNVLEDFIFFKSFITSSSCLLLDFIFLRKLYPSAHQYRIYTKTLVYKPWSWCLAEPQLAPDGWWPLPFSPVPLFLTHLKGKTWDEAFPFGPFGVAPLLPL